MQKILENNTILIYWKQKEGKSVIDERSRRTLKAKIYKKVIGNDDKSCLSYLNKLVD